MRRLVQSRLKLKSNLSHRTGKPKSGSIFKEVQSNNLKITFVKFLEKVKEKREKGKREREKLCTNPNFVCSPERVYLNINVSKTRTQIISST